MSAVALATVGRAPRKTRPQPERRLTSKPKVIPPDDLGEGLRFALKTLNLKSVNRAKSHLEVLLVCLQHNLRHGHEGFRHRSPIDPARREKNEVLWGPKDPDTALDIAANTFDELGINPKRKDAIVGIEMVFQPLSGDDNAAFYAACLRWCRARYSHLLSAVVHRDQARPHMHVIALAIQGDKLAGAALTTNENRYSFQRNDFMAFMRATLGPRPDRPTRKRKPKPKHDPLTALMLSSGKGPKTHAEAERKDAQLLRSASRRQPALADNLLAHQPPSPPDLLLKTSLLGMVENMEAALAEMRRQLLGMPEVAPFSAQVPGRA